jgi:hypothetical protein
MPGGANHKDTEARSFDVFFSASPPAPNSRDGAWFNPQVWDESCFLSKKVTWPVQPAVPQGDNIAAMDVLVPGSATRGWYATAD